MAFIQTLCRIWPYCYQVVYGSRLRRLEIWGATLHLNHFRSIFYITALYHTGK